MASPAFTYLRLDADNDPIFDPASALTNIDAVAQAILTAILLFQGEWFENLSLGTPMFGKSGILGASGSPASQKAMNLAMSQRVQAVPYVQSVINVSSNFNSGTRGFSFSVTALTAFGTVNVNAPGASASIGGS